MRLQLLVGSVVLSASLTAHANSISFSASDFIYGPQTGSVSNAIGSADVLYFDAAVAGAYETIDLTDSAGIVTDTLFSPSGMGAAYPGDAFEFDGIASGNAAIGTSCVASSTVACVINTGGSIDLSSIVSDQSFEGAYGELDGSLVVTADDSLGAVPEPSNLLLLGTGLLGIAGALRRRFA